MKYLRKKGTDRIFPYTEILAQRSDMEPFEPEPPSIQKPTEHSKPGAGWYKNRKGTWSRRIKP